MRNIKKSKKLNMLSKVIGILYFILYLLGIGTILYLDVLPVKYLIPLVLLSFIFSLFIFILLIKNKTKKKVKTSLLVLSIILIIIYSLGIYYVYNAIMFMNKINKSSMQTETYYVIVNKNSKIRKIKEIKNEKVFIMDLDDENYISAKKKLSQKVKVDYEKSNSVDSIYKEIKESNIIFISSNIYSMLDENKYDIEKIGKIIYKIEIEYKKEEVVKSVKISEESFNIYISGIDSSGKISNVARSDVNMVVTVNPNTHKILLTSIPRDYYVKLHSKGSYDKLTHTGIYGINETVTTVEDLLDIDINYYVRVNFTTMINLVDVIGGVTVNSDYSFTTHGMGVKYTFNKGINNLDGKKALAFSRERKSFKDGDRQRAKNQQIVLSAIIDKVSHSTAILTKYTGILRTMQNSFQTNVSQNEITSLVKKQINDMPSWSIEKNSLDGKDAHKTTYTYGNQSLYVMQPDNQSIMNAINKIKSITDEKN